MPEPRRGDIWFGALDPIRGHEQGGKRPVLIVSDDLFNGSPAGLVIAVPLTTREKSLPYHIEVLPPEGGLLRRSFIKCEDIRSLSVDRLIGRLGFASETTLAQVEDRIRRLLRL